MIQIASVTPWSSRARVSASFRKASAIFVEIIVLRIRPGSFDRRQLFWMCNDPGDALFSIGYLRNDRTKHWCELFCARPCCQTVIARFPLVGGFVISGG